MNVLVRLKTEIGDIYKVKEYRELRGNMMCSN